MFCDYVRRDIVGTAKQLAESGELCRVYGHKWEYETDNSVNVLSHDHFQPVKRTCCFCNVVEVETRVVTWERQV